MNDELEVRAGHEPRFYERGRSWEADRQSRAQRSERRAWLAFGAMSVITVAAVIGMASMAPLKRIVPYVFAVDKATGNTELVSAVGDRSTIGYQELIDKHWAQRYVIARESYNWKLLQNDYDTVLSLSADEVGREFAKLYEGTQARDKKYGASIEMRIKVLSVSLAIDGAGSKAVIRFEKVSKRQEADASDAPQFFVATLAFEYRPSIVGKERDLIQNPMGYRVVSYRIDAEAGSASSTAGWTSSAK